MKLLQLFGALVLLMTITSLSDAFLPHNLAKLKRQQQKPRKWGLHSSTSSPPPQSTEFILDEYSQEFYQMNLHLVGDSDYFDHDATSFHYKKGAGNTDDDDDDDNQTCFSEPSSSDMEKLCNLLDATPTNLLRFDSSNDWVRGLYLNRPIKKGNVVLSIPLGSCLTDKTYPSWLILDDDDEYNPSAWATRLGANLIDLYLRVEAIPGGISSEDMMKHSKWISLLPDKEYLKASLPVHWNDDTVLAAKSTALELAVDSAFFARAESTNMLLASLRQSEIASSKSEDELRDMCSNALDVVQTRSCRLLEGSSFPMRVLAPIFDFINHGSLNSSDDSAANVCFKLEGDHLVVRAIDDINQDEEILVDYGNSARPAWKCLVSYGFVPDFQGDTVPSSPDDVVDEDSEDVAEIFIDGTRYEVGPSFIPFEMVEKIAAKLHVGTRMIDDENGYPDKGEGDPVDLALTEEIAQKISQRISEVAYLLLLEPEMDLYDDHPAATPTVFQVISTRLSSSLRWHQHRVLLACAEGLQNFCAEEDQDEDKS